MASSPGRIDGGVHRFPVRVYYEDTDASGITYYANYLKFAERARTEWMRLMGVTNTTLRDDAGAGWVVRRCAIDYLRPARLDDDLEVRTRILALRGASAHMEQVVQRGGVDLVRLALRLAFVTTAGRPTRLPASIRAVFESAIQPQTGA